MKRAKKAPLIDEGASTCYKCGCRRCQYTCGGGTATRTCLNRACRAKVSLDVTRDVPHKIKSLEEWRGWWERVYG